MRPSSPWPRCSGRVSRIGLLALFAACALPAAVIDDPGAEAKRLAQSGQLRKAVELITTFLAANPGYTQADRLQLDLARYYDDLGEIDHATAGYQALLDADPKRRNRGEILLALGRLHAAGENWAAAATATEQALAAGVGLDQEEATLTCASYYLRLKRWEDAAAQYNVIARSGSSRAADAAAMLCMTWISSGRVNDAAAAVADFAKAFPQDERAPDILVGYATLQMQKSQFTAAATLAGQVRDRWPKSDQAQVASFILARCREEAKDLDGALTIYKALVQLDGAGNRELAAESAWQAAAIIAGRTPRSAEAIDAYEAALGLLRQCEQNQRHLAQMQQCLVRLGDAAFQAGTYAVALDYYLQLRDIAPDAGALFRITQCLQLLGVDAPKIDLRLKDTELARLRAIIAASPGTADAAQAELAIASDRLARLIDTKADTALCGPDFEKILSGYAPAILAEGGLGLSCQINLGAAYAGSPNPSAWPKAITAYEAARAAAPAGSSERALILEALAQVYDRTGKTDLSRAALKELLIDLKARAAAVDAKGQPAAQAKINDIFSVLASRPIPSALDQMIAETEAIIAKAPPLSDEARIARFYLGEYHLMRKDFGAAANAFDAYLRAFGPARTAAGDFAKPFAIKDPAIAQQYYLAAQRVANAWYLQANQAKMLDSYRWLLRNLQTKDNPHLGEAAFFVANAVPTAASLKTVDGKKEAAAAMWKGVIADTLDPAGVQKALHSWTGSSLPDTARYVLTAAQKAGVWWAQAGDHEHAAMAFRTALDLHRSQPGVKRSHGKNGQPDPLQPVLDELLPPARYLLGQSYIALRDWSRLLAVWSPYLDALREDTYRVTALIQFGHAIGGLDNYADAVTAYAVLIDEYGPPNPVDPKRNAPIPVPTAERLRLGGTWNGIRSPVPAELDQGAVRYQLGFLHWSHRAYDPCIAALAPFATSAALASNGKRDVALYMIAQSQERLERYAEAASTLERLNTGHPRFAHAAEAVARQATCQMEAADWRGLAVTVRGFLDRWPNDPWRSRIDLCVAVAQAEDSDRATGLKSLAAMATGDGSNENKSDAAYHLGRLVADKTKSLGWYETAIRLRPTARTLLAAAKTAVTDGKPAVARGHLDRLLADFADTTTARLSQARALLASLPAPTPAKP